MTIKKGNKYTYLELGEVEVITNTSRKIEGKEKKIVDLKTVDGAIHTIPTYEFQKSAVLITPPEPPKGNGESKQNNGDKTPAENAGDGNNGKAKAGGETAEAKPKKPESPGEQKPAPPSEKKMNFWPVVIIVLILVAIGVAYWWFNREAPKQ